MRNIATKIESNAVERLRNHGDYNWMLENEKADLLARYIDQEIVKILQYLDKPWIVRRWIDFMEWVKEKRRIRKLIHDLKQA